MDGQVLTKQYLIESIRDYNNALLFNRSKAKQLREKAQRILADFSQDNADLYSDDLSDYMNAYIITFGVIKKHRVSKEAMRSFNKLNRDSYARYNFIKPQKRAEFLLFKSKLFRSVASFFGRYDLTENELQQVKGKFYSQTSACNDHAALEPHKANDPKAPAAVSHTDNLRPSQDTVCQVELPSYNRKQNNAGKNKSKFPLIKKIASGPSHVKKVFFGIGITALTFLGYGKYASIDNAEAREDINRINKAIEIGKKQLEKPADTIRFDEPIFPSVISTNTISDNSTQASIAKVNIKSKGTPKASAVTVKKQNVKASEVGAKKQVLQTNQIKGASNDYQDSLAKAYKNYYDNTIALHLGEKGKTELYAQLNKAIHQGKITLPAGETMEHLALVMTVSNQVQPFSKDNKLLQKITSGDELTAGQQQQIWQIVKKAGKKAGNIKGTGSYSKYDNSSEQVKQSHNKVLQQLNARLYKINNYGGK